MKPSTIPSIPCRARVAAAVLLGLLAASAAHAQLDPLIALKRVPPRVVIVLDTSFRMLDDGNGNYYDPITYNVADDPAVAGNLGVAAGATQYRRLYQQLAFDTIQDAAHKWTALNVSVVPNTTAFASNFAAFYDGTRWEIAKKGLGMAVSRNSNPRFHWGLVRLRQNGAAWRTQSNLPRPACDYPVQLTAGTAGTQDASAACTAGTDRLGIYTPSVLGSNASATASGVIRTPAPNMGSTIAADVAGTAALLPNRSTLLIPAGLDTAAAEDRPLATALADAKATIQAAITADQAADASLPANRNTVVVLVTGGRDYAGDPAAKATEFLNVGGRRVPIFVIAVKPKAADVAQLQAIATNSGGYYMRAQNAFDVATGVNNAVQAAVQQPSDFNVRNASEYVLVSPVVGTVNLDNASSATGTALTDTVITSPTGTPIPQRNNLMLTAGFALGPSALSASYSVGFEGRLRAFRVFKPVADSTKPSGYTFTKDGTPLWPKDSSDTRNVAGMARTPADPTRRNIYTVIPGTGLVAFTTANLATLSPHMNTANAWSVINLVRNLPLGGIVSSTPAVMDPPSLDPPPDDAYGRSDTPGTYAGDHKDRRSIIFVGANDGMLHAIDARTGYEVWAFIPYNLLPKLQLLLQGHAPDQFDYYVDHSPKIAEVKMGGRWRSMLIIGEGWGGTFYQAFDVTEAGMAGPQPDSDDWSGVVTSFATGTRITFAWSFPDYSQFDPTLCKIALPVSDASPGRSVFFFGDLKTSASTAERKVGFTWSDPAVGSLDATRSVNAAIVGSGYFPAEAESSPSLPARQNAEVGHALYLISMDDGKLVGNNSGSNCTGTGCLDVGDAAGQTPKNALQADPSVSSDYGSSIAKKAYMGDLDGNYWRFSFTSTGAMTKTLLKSTAKPIYASSALMWVGSTTQYIFFATGSDMLPTAPPNSRGTGDFALYGLRELSGAVSDAFSPVPLDGCYGGTRGCSVVNVPDPIPTGGVKDSNNNVLGYASGERPSTSPSVAGEIVFFTTTVEGSATGAEPHYNLYAVTFVGGNGYPVAGSTGTAKKNSGGGSIVAPVKSGLGRATAPFVVDQHLYFASSTNTGAKVEAFGDPNDFNNGVGQVGVRILSWREIRR